MNCAGYIELIARKLEASLSAAEARALESHLAACPRCRAEIALQRRMLKVLATPEGSGLAPGFAEAVTRRALAARRLESRPSRWAYLIPVASSAVVLLLAIFYRAQIAAALAPGFSALANLAGAGLGGIGGALAGASGRAPAAAKPVAHLLWAWGSLACAGAAVLLAASRFFTPARR